MPSLTDLIQALQREQIEARFDLPTRILYSTDASIYQIEPLGVAFPRSRDELAAAIEIAATHQIPILARGAGSSLAGQAIGAALILDCSRYLTRILEINPEDRSAIVEPGVVLNTLNKAAAKYNLQFGPDPASAERATIGGSIANNATGAHSILYGMAADHLHSAEIVLADGSTGVFGAMSIEEAKAKASSDGIEASIYRAALNIRRDCDQIIQNRWPATWRRAAGYNLNYLLPWTPGVPPGWQNQFDSPGQFQLPYPPVSQGTINLAPLLAGSEGTLAVIQRARLRLVPLPRHTVLGVLAYSDIIQACDSVSALLQLDPSAIELIPDVMIRLARAVPAFSNQLSFMEGLWVDGQPPNLLVVEFAGDDAAQLLDRARKMVRTVATRSSLIADTPDLQKKIWAVRKVGLGLLASEPGELKSTAFIEDISVPVERLGDFVREMELIFKAHGTHADYYAHASAGCLHIRPMLNLKSAQGVRILHSIASEAIQLAIHLGGAASGEHGIGLARSEWLKEMYGEEILKAFHELKNAADPQGLLNPAKILDAPRMDENLRFGTEYRAKPWQTIFDFSDEAGLDGAIEMCNGAGVCRKLDGVMCPSFQATREEMHSTRGRANLLRALITRPPQSHDLPEVNQAVYEALDLCLACKGCKAECPSSVDVAKLKYEFLHHYYQSHPRKLRDYLFAYIGFFARLGHRFAWLVNPILHAKPVVTLLDRWVGLSSKRLTPALSQRSLQELMRGIKANTPISDGTIDCIFLSDPFTEYYYPEAGLAALHVLKGLGLHVQVLPVLGAGRTLISKGFLPAARQQATRLIGAVERLDPQGRLPVVGVEPSEIYTLRDEYLDFFPGDELVRKLAERAWMVDEFLVRPGTDGLARIQKLVDKRDGVRQQAPRKVLLHGHCYQKAQLPRPDGLPVGAAATKKLLELCGYEVTWLDTGCCGMAGAFGYETEHYNISMQIGELSLFPAVRAAITDENVLIAASGVSCQAQIEDGAVASAIHPIVLVDRA